MDTKAHLCPMGISGDAMGSTVPPRRARVQAEPELARREPVNTPERPPITPDRQSASPVLTISLSAGWQITSDAVQWLLQYRQGPGWRTKAFCRSRAGLLLAVRDQKLVSVISTDSVAKLRALPEYHGGA